MRFAKNYQELSKKCINLVIVTNTIYKVDLQVVYMNKKFLLSLIITSIVILSIFIGYYIFKINNISIPKNSDNYKELSFELIEDECTEFAENYGLGLLPTNASEEKITPNTALTFKTHYKQCNHTLNEYSVIPEEIINMNKEEIEQYFKDWEVKEFSTKSVVLFKEQEGICNEHFLLKEKDGYIAIYILDENNKETFNRLTEISIDCLTDTDIRTISNGIRANGREELNSILEDFE